MLTNILINIAKNDDFNRESSLFLTLQDIVGKGELYLPKSTKWSKLSYLQRLDIMKNFVKDRLNDVPTEEESIPEVANVETKTYSVPILALEWNEYTISVDTTSPEMASRIAQANGPYSCDDEGLNYHYEAGQSGMSAFQEDETETFVKINGSVV